MLRSMRRARAFQSTLPARGATTPRPWLRMPRRHFNPRSPRGERRCRPLQSPEENRFQSTLPVGGATDGRNLLEDIIRISIHAPRGGSDCFRFQSYFLLYNFNPRSPWGERPGLGIKTVPRSGFQSTLPVGGATLEKVEGYHLRHDFNPRSPWGERPPVFYLDYITRGFQSTLPVGGATRSRT